MMYLAAVLLVVFTLSNKKSNTSAINMNTVDHAQPSSPSPKTFLVVGAGMAGLAAARCLAKNKNVHVEVVERRVDALEQKGSAYSLAKNGQKAMNIISPSILEHCQKVGIPVFEGSLLLPWFEVRQQLWKECQEMTNVNIRLGVTLTSVEDNNDSDNVIAKFADSDLEIRCDTLIGADGVRSTVRDLLGLPKATPMGSIMWRGQINTRTKGSKLDHLHGTFGYNPLKNFRVGKTMIFLFSFEAKVPGLLTWVVSTQQSDGNNSSNSDIQEDTSPWDLIQQEESFSSTPPETVEILKQLFTESSERDLRFHTALSVTPLSATSWFTKGRVTLIGDAAHAIMPTNGLGGSLAFEDVVILTGLLEENNFEDIPKVLKEYEERRIPRVSLISAEQMERSKARRAGSVRTPMPWDDEYRDWVYMGHEAPSHFVSSTNSDPLVITFAEEKKVDQSQK